MHSCPDCGQACYCHGDIDDSEVETPEYSSSHCTCCIDDPGDDEPDDDHDAECVCNACCDRRAGNAPQPEDA